MTERMNLSMENLEMINGGTDMEPYDMAVLLTEKGYGDFYIANPNVNGSYLLNMNAMHSFFVTKSDKFSTRNGLEYHNIWNKKPLARPL